MEVTRTAYYWRLVTPPWRMRQPPHCITAQTCDRCQVAFGALNDAGEPPARYAYPCGHVFCRPCFEDFQDGARKGRASFCVQCQSCVARPVNSPMCRHQVPVRNVRGSDFVPGGDAVFQFTACADRVQRSRALCQRCSLVSRLRELSISIQQGLNRMPFPGEVFACAEINGHSFHGMLREPEDAAVNPVEDTPVLYDREKLNNLAADLVAVLDRSPLEANFNPQRGTLSFAFRVRKYKPWIDNRLVAVHLKPQQTPFTTSALPYSVPVAAQPEPIRVPLPAAAQPEQRWPPFTSAVLYNLPAAPKPAPLGKPLPAAAQPKLKPMPFTPAVPRSVPADTQPEPQQTPFPTAAHYSMPVAPKPEPQQRPLPVAAQPERRWTPFKSAVPRSVPADAQPEPQQMPFPSASPGVSHRESVAGPSRRSSSSAAAASSPHPLITSAFSPALNQIMKLRHQSGSAAE